MLSSAKRRPWRSFPSSDTTPINHAGEVPCARSAIHVCGGEKGASASMRSVLCHPSRLARPPELRLQRLHLRQQIAALPHHSTQVVECRRSLSCCRCPFVARSSVATHSFCTSVEVRESHDSSSSEKATTALLSFNAGRWTGMPSRASQRWAVRTPRSRWLEICFQPLRILRFVASSMIEAPALENICAVTLASAWFGANA